MTAKKHECPICSRVGKLIQCDACKRLFCRKCFVGKVCVVCHDFFTEEFEAEERRRHELTLQWRQREQENN